MAALKPRLRKKALRVPLAMILFGMINWTFTWLRPDGALSYDDMSEVIADVFLWGVCDRDPARSHAPDTEGTSRSQTTVKLATLRSGGRDGKLIVVSRDLKRAVAPSEIAPNLQTALDDWDAKRPSCCSSTRC